MKVLLEELQLKHDPETLKAIMRRASPAPCRTWCWCSSPSAACAAAAWCRRCFARKIFAERGEGAAAQSAIQITTAAGICAAVDLFREGALPQRGFIRQEQVPLPAFLANRFGAAYQQSRQVESIG